VTNANQQTGTRLAPGNWGGMHVNLLVTDSGASVSFDCGHGTIGQPIALDDSGRFDVNGTYTEEGPGPTRQGREPPADSARYYGSVSGDTMTLTIARAGSSDKNAPLTLTRGKVGKVGKCG
jgi:hypothetical protein